MSNEEYIRYWLEGVSSPDKAAISDCVVQHREAVEDLVRFSHNGADHGMVAHNVAHFARCFIREFHMEPLTGKDVASWSERWVRWQEMDLLTPTIKWVCPYIFAVATGQEIPPPPEHLNPKGASVISESILRRVFPGRVGSFIKSVVRKLRSVLSVKPKDKAALGHAQTLRFLPKGTARVSEREINAALEKHRKALCEVDGYRPKDEVDSRQLKHLKWEVRRTAFDIFRGRKYKPRDKPFFPSRKGHFAMTGILGGAASAILQAWRASQDGVRAFEGYGFCPAEAVVLGSCSEFTQDAFASSVLSWMKDEMYSVVVYTPDGPKLSSCMLAAPVAVTEPCKVRIVTKGPEFTYWYLRSLQQFLWGVLKDHPCCGLIGEPISEAWLNNRFRDVPEGNLWLSGDYRASTDNLRACLSRTAARAVSEAIGLTPFDAECFEKALVGHTLEYTKKVEQPDGSFKKYYRRQEQTNGQLMGSPVSFPILCLVNLALCRASLEDSTLGEPVTGRWADETEAGYSLLEDLPLAVNGDDLLESVESMDRYHRWEAVTRRGGLESSVGKTYISQHFVQMNSTTYVVDYELEFGPLMENEKRRRRPFFTHVPYVNFGFLSPFDPKGGAERTYRDLPALAHEFIKGFSPERADVLMQWFLKDHQGLLRQCPEGMSYWLPVHLGGLGLPVTRHLEEGVNVTDFQMNFAEYLLHHSEDPTTLPSGEKTVPGWVRQGERRAAQMRTRQKGGVKSRLPWNDERSIREDEQFLYWEMALKNGMTRKEMVVPASRGNFFKLRRKFINSGLHAHSPLATLLNSPAPHMVLAPGVCDLAERKGFNPTGLYKRISSKLRGEQFTPCERNQGRVLEIGGLRFDIGARAIFVQDPLDDLVEVWPGFRVKALWAASPFEELTTQHAFVNPFQGLPVVTPTD